MPKLSFDTDIVISPDGKKRKDAFWSLFRRLCWCQSTLEEICVVMDSDVQPLNRKCKERFGKTANEMVQRFAEGGKASLRRAMMRKALKGDNPAMMKWLSANYLGMSEKVEHSGDRKKPVLFQFVDPDGEKKAEPE